MSIQVGAPELSESQRRSIKDPAVSEALTPNIVTGMARQATLRIAAGIISDPHFPRPEHLPRMTALPFVNLGHILLLDYDLLGRVLWQAAFELTDMCRSAQRRRRREGYLLWGGGLVIAIVLSALLGSGSGAELALMLCFVVLGLLRSRDVVEETAADYKRHLISQLLAGKVPDRSGHAPETSEIAWADGRLSPERSPLLVAMDGRRFPGFGREQGIETFICARDPEKPDRRETNEPYRIYEAVLEAAVATGLPRVQAGYVLVAEADLLEPGNPLLDEQGRPRLWIPAEELGQLARSESARMYFAVQVFLPERQTAATLFVRAFSAGDAAAVEVSLSSLGPPCFDAAHFRERLHQLGSHRRRRDFKKYHWRHFLTDLKRIFRRRRRPMSYLVRLRKLTESRKRVVLDPLKASGAADREGFQAIDPEERAGLEYEGAEYRREMTRWPGNWPGLWNWREEYAFLLPPGAFEGAETRATIRALYEKIASKVLDTLKEMGYDITKYRDRDGRLNIHAEVIDSLVVGEKVVMKGAKGEGKGSRKPKKQSPATGGKAAA